MAANNNPIFPVTPILASASLATTSACTTRYPTAHASLTSTPVAGVQLLVGTANGIRIDKIQVQACNSVISTANSNGTVLIWVSDGTTGYVIDEIQVVAITPSSTTPALNTSHYYTTFILPYNYYIFVSSTIGSSYLQVNLFGGAY
jgi:hypothetical protein